MLLAWCHTLGPSEEMSGVPVQLSGDTLAEFIYMCHIYIQNDCQVIEVQ